MKNYDLIWARDWAGLTQAEAAEKIGVHRDTFSRWEIGARKMPARKWQKFLKAVAVNTADIPKRPEPLKYKADGYPVGFDSGDYEDLTDEAEEAALRELEGSEYEVRERERYRILMTRHMDHEASVRHMASYDEESRRIAAGIPARPCYLVQAHEYSEAELRRSAMGDYERLAPWERDMKAIERHLRDNNATLPVVMRKSPEAVVREIRRRQAWLDHLMTIMTGTNVWDLV